MTSVYQRGWVINSQLFMQVVSAVISISKGMGDQFSAFGAAGLECGQYIKGDG